VPTPRLECITASRVPLSLLGMNAEDVKNLEASAAGYAERGAAFAAQLERVG
jgi:hypothetical protein